MSAPRALYIGYTRDTFNHGDEALMEIVRDLFAPEIDVRFTGSEFELALLGSGTLINQSPWLIDRFADALQVAGRGAVFGAGVGDAAFWGDGFDRWVPLLERCEFVGVRGPRSRDLLASRGFARAEVIGDPYLAVAAPDGAAPRPRLLGVNLGSTNDSLWGTDDRDFHAFMMSALADLRAAGWTFRWFSVWEKDSPILDAIRLEVAPESPAVIDVRADPVRARELLAECETFAGEKLHANAMAAVCGVPFLSLEYQPKVRDFAASLDMEAWTIATSERDKSAVTSRVESLSARRDEIRRGMIARRETLRAALRDFVARVKHGALDASGSRIARGAR
jgi:polysaccharide pyruvyl transferase WcaK-like protein